MIGRYELIFLPCIAWLVSQGIKFILTLRKDGMQLADLYTSGGFPSSHTSAMVAVAVLYGLRYGFDDPLFAVLALFSAIVMYDAIGVRRSSGEQALAIRELSKKAEIKLSTRMHAAQGHTPLEVLGGVLVGVALAVLFYLAI